MRIAQIVLSRIGLLVVATVALGMGSCTFSDDKTHSCKVDADCSLGQHCYHEFCVSDLESDTRPGTDAGKGGTTAQGGSSGAGRAGSVAAAGATGAAGAGGKGRAGAGGRSGSSGAAVGGGGAGLCTEPVSCTVAAEDVAAFNGCGEGQRECVDGKLAECRPTRTRSAEVCNGIDDDCDSKVDEPEDVEPCYPIDTAGCAEDAGKLVCVGICKLGKRSCVDGIPGECVGATPPMSMEVCGGPTAQDDDCNGTVDDKCKCTNAQPLPCYQGDASELFAGSECKEGKQACIAGVLGLCLDQRRKMAETCGNPGHDDDCNKVVDDIPGLSSTCSVAGMKGPCSAGTMQCKGADLTCTATVMPKAEVCNGIDDDCDGVPDQPFNTLTDRSHCGRCNHACTATETCKAGVCTLISEPGEDAGM